MDDTVICVWVMRIESIHECSWFSSTRLHCGDLGGLREYTHPSSASILDSFYNKMNTRVRTRNVIISICRVCSDGTSERGGKDFEFELFPSFDFLLR